jgi:hypothetical protein
VSRERPLRTSLDYVFAADDLRIIGIAYPETVQDMATLGAKCAPFSGLGRAA